MVLRRRLLALTGVLAISSIAGLSASARRAGRKRGAAVERRRVIALDPGHGGADPGAISQQGLMEKNLTLATASELARHLARSGRYKPVMTRRGDVFVSLERRVRLARSYRAELFLSIHVNLLPNPALRGLSVYTLSQHASDEETAALAASENREDVLSRLHLSREPRDIASILLDLTRRHTENCSLRLARDVVVELGREVPLLEKPQRSAGFVVLTAPDIPSALVEIGCLSNLEEERLLPTHAYQRRLAHGLAAAIDDYFASAVVV